MEQRKCKNAQRKHRILGSAREFTAKTLNINHPSIIMPVEIQILKEKKIIKLYKLDSLLPPSQSKMLRFVPSIKVRIEILVR